MAGDPDDDGYEEKKIQYERAIAYLKTSETGAALISKLETSKQTVTINLNPRESGGYSAETKSIDWLPTQGRVLGDKKSVVSPALVLAHEFGHAAQDLDGERTKLDITTLRPPDRHELEAANLKRYEIPIAKELGEFQRKDHSDKSKWVRVGNSTDWGTIRTVRTFRDYVFNWSNWGKPSKVFENKNTWKPPMK